MLAFVYSSRSLLEPRVLVWDGAEEALGESDERLDESPKIFRRAIVATDVSDRTQKVVGLASQLAKALNIEKVLVVAVSTVTTGVQGNEVDGLPANSEERKTAESLREAVDQAFGAAGDRVDVKVLHGDAAERIVEYSNYADCDLIIVGSRGQGPLRRAVGGSVSMDVVAKSDKPVIVVK